MDIPKEGVVFDATVCPLLLSDVPGSKYPVPFVVEAGASLLDASPILRDLGSSVVVLLAVTVTVTVPLFDFLTTVLRCAWSHCCILPL